jgi:signal transduction histidine kinase
MQTEKMNSEYVEIIKKISGRVKREVQRMTHIMNEVLTLGKISSGTVTLVLTKPISNSL